MLHTVSDPIAVAVASAALAFGVVAFGISVVAIVALARLDRRHSVPRRPDTQSHRATTPGEIAQLFGVPLDAEGTFAVDPTDSHRPIAGAWDSMIGWEISQGFAGDPIVVRRPGGDPS